jgi:hypothetical protein
MEKLKIRCRSCNKELEGHPSRTVSCGCPNMATIRGGVISAVDLSLIVMLNSPKEQSQSNGVLTPQDLAFQEERRKRKVRRLDFEVR